MLDSGSRVSSLSDIYHQMKSISSSGATHLAMSGSIRDLWVLLLVVTFMPLGEQGADPSAFAVARRGMCQGPFLFAIIST